ncbi:692_t:CDS:2, partial [Cetraspora pellucida]
PRGRPRKLERQAEEMLKTNLPIVEIPVLAPAQVKENLPSPPEELDLKITEPSTTMVVTANRVRVRALGKVVEVELYVQYDYKVAKIPISCNGENPPMEPEDEEDEGTFDEFEFEDESLEEAEGYFTCKTPATYLSHIEELPSNEPEPEPEEEESLEVKLEKSVCSSSLPLEQCQRALEKLDSRDGVRPDDSKVDKIKTFPTPVNLRQLRGFIGLMSYYRKFIPNFASIARPLHYLLKKEV